MAGLLIVVVGCDKNSTDSTPGSTTYRGQATAVSGTVVGNDVHYSDTGPLPPEGGALDATLLNADVSGLGSLQVLHATVVGEGNATYGEASLADVSVNAGGHTVTADFIMSQANATCDGSHASVSGESDVEVLVIDTTHIQVTAQPNQEFQITDTSGAVVGRVIVNEQISSVTGHSGEIRVNALHVQITGFVDLVLSSAYAGVTCDHSKPGEDFVTGGGWITGTPSGSRANFGVAGGIRNGAFWGHLTYIDHTDPMLQVHGTGVTAYTVVSPTVRRIEGNAEINGAGGTYQVTLTDNGEPSRNDSFNITLSTGYTASGNLMGGNIQIHTGG